MRIFVFTVRFHAPTRWTQKLKLLGRGGQSTNTSQHPTHMQPEQGANVEIKKGAEDLKDASTKTQDLWLWYHVRFHAPTRWTQKLKLLERGGQSTNTSQQAQTNHRCHRMVPCHYFLGCQHFFLCCHQDLNHGWCLPQLESLPLHYRSVGTCVILCFENVWFLIYTALVRKYKS